MALELQQNLKNQQQLSMTPQLQQAIRILQFSSLELEAYIGQQIFENPLLESVDENSFFLKEKNDQFLDKKKHNHHQNQSNNFDFNYITKHKVGSSHLNQETNYENYTSYETTLQNHLINQMTEIELDEREKNCTPLN